MFIDYRNASNTREGFSDWLATWVDPVRTCDDYLDRLGPQRTEGLALTEHVLSEPAEFGYCPGLRLKTGQTKGFSVLDLR